jgi:hypothetical protein
MILLKLKLVEMCFTYMKHNYTNFKFLVCTKTSGKIEVHYVVASNVTTALYTSYYAHFLSLSRFLKFLSIFDTMDCNLTGLNIFLDFYVCH